MKKIIFILMLVALLALFAPPAKAFTGSMRADDVTGLILWPTNVDAPPGSPLANKLAAATNPTVVTNSTIAFLSSIFTGSTNQVYVGMNFNSPQANTVWYQANPQATLFVSTNNMVIQFAGGNWIIGTNQGLGIFTKGGSSPAGTGWSSINGGVSSPSAVVYQTNLAIMVNGQSWPASIAGIGFTNGLASGNFNGVYTGIANDNGGEPSWNFSARIGFDHNAEPSIDTDNRILIGPWTLPGLSVVFVSPTGSDANLGTISSPVATLTNALAILGGNGTIEVRGGVYTSWRGNMATAGSKVLIERYNGETNNLDFGYTLSSFSYVSNTTAGAQIYSAALTSAQYMQLTNLSYRLLDWNGGYPTAIWQVGTPYGLNFTNDPVNNTIAPYITMNTGIQPGSFRMSDTPLLHTPSLSTSVGVLQTNQLNAGIGGTALANGWIVDNVGNSWFTTNNTLYVVFSDGKTNTGRSIQVPAFDTNASAIYNIPTNCEVTLRGITVKYGFIGFQITGAKHAVLEDCHALSCYDSGFFVGNPAITGGGLNIGGAGQPALVPTGDIELKNCSAAGSSFGVNIGPQANGGILIGPPTHLTEFSCNWHDCWGENDSARRNVVREVWGGFNSFSMFYATVDEGSVSEFHDVNFYYDAWGILAFAIQLGDGNLGLTSRVTTWNCNFYHSWGAVEFDDGRNLYVDHGSDMSGIINVGLGNNTANDGTTHAFLLGTKATEAFHSFGVSIFQSGFNGGGGQATCYFSPYIIPSQPSGVGFDLASLITAPLSYAKIPTNSVQTIVSTNGYYTFVTNSGNVIATLVLTNVTGATGAAQLFGNLQMTNLSNYSGGVSPVTITNFNWFIGGGFIGSTNQGTMTNTLAGYYTESCTFVVNESDIGSADYFLGFFTNGVQAGVSFHHNIGDSIGNGVLETFSDSGQVFFLPAGTRCEWKINQTLGTENYQVLSGTGLIKQ